MTKKTNKQVLTQVKQSRSPLTTMKKRQLQFWTYYQSRENWKIWLFVGNIAARKHEDVQNKCTWTRPAQRLDEFKHSTYPATSL